MIYSTFACNMQNGKITLKAACKLMGLLKGEEHLPHVCIVKCEDLHACFSLPRTYINSAAAACLPEHCSLLLKMTIPYSSAIVLYF